MVKDKALVGTSGCPASIEVNLITKLSHSRARCSASGATRRPDCVSWRARPRHLKSQIERSIARASRPALPPSWSPFLRYSTALDPWKRRTLRRSRGSHCRALFTHSPERGETLRRLATRSLREIINVVGSSIDRFVYSSSSFSFSRSSSSNLECVLLFVPRSRHHGTTFRESLAKSIEKRLSGPGCIR